ncbi:succinylglutamate desuccinylase/aspartoacylase family protein [Candidatus Riflebacteria bacterium]
MLSLCACLHGNEPVGINAVNNLLDKLHYSNFKFNGEIRIILGNLRALQKNSRNINCDLNRCFSDILENDNLSLFERKRVGEIKEFIKGSKYIIDIHSSSSPSPPFLAYPHKSCPPYLIPLKFLKYHTYNWATHLRGTCLMHWAYEQGIESFVLECGQHNLDTTLKNGILILNEFLSLINIFPSKSKKKVKEIPILIKIEDCIFADEEKLQLLPKPIGFTSVKVDDMLLKGAKSEIKSAHDGFIIFPNERAKPGEAILYLGRTVTPPPFWKLDQET